MGAPESNTRQKAEHSNSSLFIAPKCFWIKQDSMFTRSHRPSYYDLIKRQPNSNRSWTFGPFLTQVTTNQLILNLSNTI